MVSLVEHRLQAHELLYSQHPGSTVEAHGLQSVGLVATQHAGFIHLQHGGLPDQGLICVPALAGRSLTTRSPGKSLKNFFSEKNLKALLTLYFCIGNTVF